MLRVKKRDGRLEEVLFDKVTNRIKYLVKGVLRDGQIIGQPLDIGYAEIARNVISNITDGISSRELDEYAARLCATRVDENYQYSVLAGRIAVSNHQKNTLGSFSDTMKLLYENCDPQGNAKPLLRKSFMKSIMKNRAAIEETIDYSRDYQIDYFGFMTLERSYFLRRSSLHFTVVERPQHVYMRIAVALHGDNIERVKETYHLLSLGILSHASPTMYNAGTTSEQMSSCYLLPVADSMDDDGGIPDCWKSCAKISKRAGGIGVGITPVRGTGSLIRGVNGPSDGIIPMIRVFNDIASYVNQGGRRKGSFAMYLEPWHPDVFAFLDLKKNHGKEEMRARDLFYALWIPDLFMKRLILALETDTPVKWSLMCPDASHKNGNPRLYDTYGAEFERIYEDYEQSGLAVQTIADIRDLWFAILTSQKETGVPYMLYKDHVNHKNNQSNLGTIRNSNLCAEIVEYSNHEEHAVCNLASIVLHQFVGEKSFDFKRLFEVSKVALRNLDRVIDINFYPTPETKCSNMRHRPVGLGVQGLADVFILMRYPFDSPEAARLNRQIFETIYYGCMTASMELARERIEKLLPLKNTISGFSDEMVISDREIELPITKREFNSKFIGAYSSFEGSPMSQGKFQFDLWNESPDPELGWNWNELRENVLVYGVRNSLTTAIMPTASTASILKSVECIEPIKSNLYTRRVLSGEYVLTNQYLQMDLQKLGLWNDFIRKKIVADRGSVQEINEIPADIRNLYKTAFEIKQKVILDLARGRAPFIDQTQSMNIYVKEPNNKALTSIHVYGWQCGLKTGMYYLRRMPKAEPIQFTVDQPNLADCLSCSA